MSHLTRARKVFDVELAALKSVRARLDDAFDRAVELSVETLRRRGKIVIVGIGKSGNIGRKIAATASTTAMLVMGDALAMAVLQARGFKEQDFARHHPAGAIGRSLLLQVRDIMRTEERNAVAEQTLSVKEALLLMTRAKSGSV